MVIDVTKLLPPTYQRPSGYESLFPKKGALFTPCAGTRRYALLFSLLCGVIFCLPENARAASWDWSRQNGRERVVIRLDGNAGRGEAVRDGSQSLAVHLDALPQSLEARQPLPQNSLIRGISIDPATRALRVDTSTPAFGFIVTTPGNGSIILDMFPDSLGARWRPDGTLAPASAPVIPIPREITEAAPPLPPSSTQAASAVTQTPPPAREALVQSAAPASQTTPSAPQAQVQQPQNREISTNMPSLAAESAPRPVTAETTPTQVASLPPLEAASPERTQTQIQARPQVQPAAQPSSPLAQTGTPQTTAQMPTQLSQQGPPPTPAAQPGSPAPAVPVTSLPPAQPSSSSPAASSVSSSAPSATVPGTAQIPMNASSAQGQILSAPSPQISISVNTGQNGPAPTASGVSAAPGTTPGTPVAPPQVPNTPQASPPPPPSSTNTGHELSHTVSAAGEPLVSARMNMGGPETWQDQPATTSGAIAGHGGEQGNLNITVSVPSSEKSIAPISSSTANAEAFSMPEPMPQQPSASGGAGIDTARQPVSPLNEAELSKTSPESPVPSDSGSLSDTKTQKQEAENSPATQPAPMYVDEQGNPVPPPPDIPTLLKDVSAKMERGDYAGALPDLETLKQADLPSDEREDVLYNYMKALYEKYHPNFGEHAEEIIDAANAAMNFNLDSYRVPEALSTLASVNIGVGNIEDAKGYVYLMRRKYHGNPQVPSSLLNLGKEYLRRQDYADASIAFTQVLEEYPDSKNAKDAGLLQVHSLYRQGHYDRALTLIEFVDRRWPRIYLEDEQYLPISADVQMRQGKYDDALETYWKQYNLHPSDSTSPGVLMRIGELYYQTQRPLSAGKALEELVRAFPTSPEAPRALLLLGENGINEGNPDLDELLAIFDRPNPRIPGIFYQHITADYPSAPEAVSARLRTIAWLYWDKQYVQAMDGARSFMIDYEDKPESLRAQDILLRAFAVELANALSEENYERVLALWERYPQVQPYYQPLEPELRVALARAQLNRGKEAAGLELVAPFLETHENPDYGLYAYNLYLSSYLRAQNWNGILTLGDKVRDWNLPTEARHQLDYAMALSAENLQLPGRALPLWKTLAPLNDIPLYQRAYANYFLARDAERRQDLRDAYQYNLDTLGMFTQLQDERSPYADSERIRESIAALMDVTEIAGRYAEALEWATQYAAFVPDTSPDYAGLRFREARLHRKMGDTARWRAILQGIVDSEPDSAFGKMAASELHTSNVARDLSRFTEKN